jgi:CheY-like chemotaxis protein
VHANREFAVHVRVGVDVAFERGGTLVRGDAEQLAQVFGQLLHHATLRSAANQRIEIRVYPSGDTDVAVSVRDHGAGPATHLLETVFGRARDGETGCSHPDVARGGSPLVRSLAGLHGGTVSARDTGAGQGNEFVVTLATASATRLSVVAPPQPHVEARRILVVDDHRDSADTLQLLLELDGHAVAVAYEGAGALALAGQFRPDVVILDLDLPDISGYEVARRLRALPDAARLVALSGYGGERCLAMTHDAGFEHHLLKPIDLAALRHVLAPCKASATARVLAGA